MCEDCKKICENTEKFEENCIYIFEKIVGPLYEKFKKKLSKIGVTTYLMKNFFENCKKKNFDGF